MSNMSTAKSGMINLRSGIATKRLKDAKTKMERMLGIPITWPQFFDRILNQLEGLEAGKK